MKGVTGNVKGSTHERSKGFRLERLDSSDVLKVWQIPRALFRMSISGHHSNWSYWMDKGVIGITVEFIIKGDEAERNETRYLGFFSLLED